MIRIDNGIPEDHPIVTALGRVEARRTFEEMWALVLDVESREGPVYREIPICQSLLEEMLARLREELVTRLTAQDPRDLAADFIEREPELEAIRAAVRRIAAALEAMHSVAQASDPPLDDTTVDPSGSEDYS